MGRLELEKQVECISAKGSVVILCSAWSQAVPESVVVAPCKFGLTFITARYSCACTNVPRSIWKAFVLLHHSRKNCLLQGPLKYLLPTRSDRLKLNREGTLFVCSSTQMFVSTEACVPFF